MSFYRDLRNNLNPAMALRNKGSAAGTGTWGISKVSEVTVNWVKPFALKNCSSFNALKLANVRVFGNSSDENASPLND